MCSQLRTRFGPLSRVELARPRSRDETPRAIRSLPMKLARRPDRERGERLLADVGLARKSAALLDEVSVGEHQRAAFARALANEPDVLLADEPTAALGPENARVVAAALAVACEAGRTVVAAGHDLRLKEGAWAARAQRAS
ncbi:MAG: ATP-binding cassette domain-containing protein [Thermoplasmatota archaeon]